MSDWDGHDDRLDRDDPPRSTQVRNALLKAGAVVAGIAVLIFLGTSVVVGALDLDQGDTSTPAGAAPAGPDTPLPTTALPVPGDESDTPSEDPSDLVSPKEPKDGQIQLSVSPVTARPMERVNLTGNYPGQDNVGLQVQRKEGGQWVDFGVGATVRVGTFETYVMTGRSGDNSFRVFDPQARKGSNPVVVTID